MRVGHVLLLAWVAICFRRDAGWEVLFVVLAVLCVFDVLTFKEERSC